MSFLIVFLSNVIICYRALPVVMTEQSIKIILMSVSVYMKTE